VVALFFTGVDVVSVVMVGGIVAACLWAVETVRRSASPDAAEQPEDTPGGAP